MTTKRPSLLTTLPDISAFTIVLKVVLDEDGKVSDLLFSKTDNRIEKFTLYKADDLIGRSFYEVFPQANKAWTDLAYQAAYRNEETHGRLYSKQARRWIEFDVSQTRKSYCSLTMYDITDRHLAFQAEKVSHRTADIIILCAKQLQQQDNIHHAMDSILATLSKVITAEQIFIVTTGKEGAKFYLRRGDESEDLVCNISLYRRVAHWQKRIKESGKIVVKDIEDIKESDPENYALLQQYNLYSLMVLPMYEQDNLLGFMGVDNFQPTNAVNIEELLETVSFFIASELRNYRLIKELQRLSHSDFLTGVNNRNALNKTVKNMYDLHPNIGILYADLNGLKEVNDVKGHTAGDQYIQSAATLLKKIFPEESIYRAGGDEFVVFDTESTREKFDNKVKKLQSLLEAPSSPALAIGWIWEENCQDILTAMAKADANMYDNKTLYYKTHKKYR